MNKLIICGKKIEIKSDVRFFVEQKTILNN